MSYYKGCKIKLTERSQIVELYLKGKTRYYDTDLKQNVIIPIAEGEITSCNSLLIFQYDKLSDEFRRQIMVQSCIRNLLLEHSIGWTSYIRNMSHIMQAQSKTIDYYYSQKQKLLKYPIENGSTIHKAFLETYNIDKERVVRNKLFIDDTIKNSGLQPLADAILNECGVSIFDYTDAFIKKCKEIKPLKLSRDFTTEECQTIVDEYYRNLDAAYLNHIKKFAKKRNIDLSSSIQERQAQDEVVQNARRAEIRAEKKAEKKKEFEKKVKAAIDNKICDLNNILLNYADGRGMQRYVYERVTHTLLSFDYKAYMIVVSKGKSKIKYVGSDCELHNLADAMFFATDSDEKLLEFTSTIKEKYPDWYVSVENLDISCLRNINASDYERSIVGNTYDSESIITHKLDEAEAYLVRYLNTEYGSKHSRAVTTMATLFKQTGADTLRYVVFYRNGTWHYVRRADLLKVINNDFVRGVSTMSVDNIGYAVDDDEVRILCDIAKNVYGTNDYRICTISRSDIPAIDDVMDKFNNKKINALVNMKAVISSLKEDTRFTSKSKLLIKYSYDGDDCCLYRFGKRKDGRRIKWSRLTNVIGESVCISNDDATDFVLNDALYEFARERSTSYVYEIISMDDIQSVVPN